MATTTRSLTVPGRGTESHSSSCGCGCAPCCEGTCCRLDCLEQPRFFCGQLLTDQDLSALVSWTRDKFALSRYKHGWGVVCGLDVRCASDARNPLRVAVMPGYAIGCCGDDIIICEDATLDLSDACREEADPCAELRKQLRGAPAVAGGGRTDASGNLTGGTAAAGTGSIRGNAVTADGAPVPNASIRIRSDATGFESRTTADADGHFNAVGLPAGTYTVIAFSPGFMIMAANNVVVRPNAITNVTVSPEGGGESTPDEENFRVVDIYLRYAEKPSGMTTALGRSSCKEVSECEHNRTQESYTLTYELGTLDGDPVESAARRWREGYEKCLDVLVQFRRQFSFASPPNGEDVRRWLIKWIERHPLSQFCYLRDEICRANADQLSDQRQLTRWLFAFVQDCRNAYLNCDCGACETDTTGVPLARVWLQSSDERWGKENCRIVQIDPYPPFRRPLSPDSSSCWPAPLGSVNVGRAIWHRRQEACTMLSDLGVRISEEREFTLPDTLRALEDALRCDPFVECDEERAALYYRFGLHGERIVGFCTGAAIDVPPEDAREVSLTVTCRRRSPAGEDLGPAIEVRPQDFVEYTFTVENTSGVALNSVVLKDTATGFTNPTGESLAVGEVRPWQSGFVQVNKLPRPGNNVHNVATFSGVAPDGQPVNASASHDLSVIGVRVDTDDEPSRRDDFTAIRGIGENRATVLHEAGINSYAELAATPVEKLKELFTGVSEGVLSQWIENAKSLTQ